jgi:GntR family transcriptional regulator/MocR family aminotransferase
LKTGLQSDIILVWISVKGSADVHISIDHNSRTPAYMQIYSAIRNMIVNGAYPTGTRLPSKRELARDSGVSIITAEHAYQLLAEEGLCELRARSGCYVKYTPEHSFPLSDYLQDNTSEYNPADYHNDDIPFSAVASKLRKVILDQGERILMKSPNNGCTELREAICRYLARSRNINVTTEQIVIGSGAEYLYGLCIQMLGRDRIVALENPSYRKIREVYTANGASCELLSMDSEGIRINELIRSKAGILHVTPFNSFPSHITASAERRQEYLNWAKERKAVIIEDDYDSEFSLTGTAPQTLFAQTTDGNVIYLNTFSKTIAPSLRVGYMILPTALIPLYQQTVSFYSCTVPMLEQFFLTEWLDSGEFERNISRIRNKP